MERILEYGIGGARVARAPAGARASKAAWAGRAVSAVAVIFLAADAAAKLLQLPAAVEGTTRLGYPAGAVFGIGLLLAACLVLHLVPRTAVLGAVLLTAYLGGAVATQVRAGNPILAHTLFPVYVAAFLWAGLWLRDQRVRALLPVRGAA